MVVQHVALINKLCRFDFLCVYQLSLSLETKNSFEKINSLDKVDRLTFGSHAPKQHQKSASKTRNIRIRKLIREFVRDI